MAACHVTAMSLAASKVKVNATQLPGSVRASRTLRVTDATSASQVHADVTAADIAERLVNFNCGACTITYMSLFDDRFLWSWRLEQ